MYGIVLSCFLTGITASDSEDSEGHHVPLQKPVFYLHSELDKDFALDMDPSEQCEVMSTTHGYSPCPWEENLRNADGWCVTHMTAMKFNFTWIIQNFSLCPESTGESFDSCVFSPDSNDATSWSVTIMPRGFSQESTEYISLFLEMVSCSNLYVWADFEFSLLNDKQISVKSKRTSRSCWFAPGKNWGFEKFVRREILFDKVNGVLPDDTLTIVCQVSLTIAPESVNVSVQPMKSKIQTPDCSLVEDFGKMLNDQKLSDFLLRACGRDFYVHKAVISARCPIFETVIEYHMEEGSNKIELPDTKHENLKAMLDFMYTGECSNLETMAEEILVLAERFHLQRLRLMCEQILAKRLTQENATEMFILADCHNAELLKACAYNYMRKHMQPHEKSL